MLAREEEGNDDQDCYVCYLLNSFITADKAVGSGGFKVGG